MQERYIFELFARETNLQKKRSVGLFILPRCLAYKYYLSTNYCTVKSCFNIKQTSNQLGYFLWPIKILDPYLLPTFFPRVCLEVATCALNPGQHKIQVNIFQKHLFLHQLTHNMTTDCLMNYKFSTRKLQVQYMFKLFCMSKQKHKKTI